MKNFMFDLFYSCPVEQFDLVPFLSFRLGSLDISVTNETLALAICFGISALLYFTILTKDSSFSMLPDKFQAAFEIIYSSISLLISENIKYNRGQFFFPIVFVLFFFILLMNLLGMFPYSFTLTSHLVFTFALSIAVFFGINYYGFSQHGLNAFSLFLPSGTSFFLGLILVPIELISYIFKPFSLAIRLFSNILAGHTLLKVLAGFAMSLASISGVLYFVPTLLIFPLLGLEIFLAIVQAFVFSILTCIYLNDVINLH